MAVPVPDPETSPAGELRQALAHMREHHPYGHPRHAFWTELADWLGVQAAIMDRRLDVPRPSGVIPPAVRIARAYLLGTEGSGDDGRD